MCAKLPAWTYLPVLRRHGARATGLWPGVATAHSEPYARRGMVERGRNAAVSLTRRQLLARGAIALAALGGGSLAFARPLAAARPTREGGFDAARRAEYVALVAAVGSLTGARVDQSRSRWAADWLADYYARRPTESRVAIDGVLDGLDGFAAMRSHDRIRTLRSWSRAGSDTRELAEQAAALAALPFTPEPESEDDVIKPVPVAL